MGLKFNSIKVRLIFSYFTISLIAIVLFEGTLIFAVPQYYKSGVEQYVITKVKEGAENFQVNMYDYYPYESALRELVVDMKKDTKGKIQIINAEGKIINDSTGFILLPVATADDFKQAVADGAGMTYLDHPATGEALLMAAQKIYFEGEYYILRLVISVEALNTTIRQGIIIIIGFGILLLCVTLLISIYIASSITKPVSVLIDAAKQITNGNYKLRVKKFSNDEVGELSDAINTMASELDKTEEMRSDFIALVSHELRTPLTAIKGWAETLEFMITDITNDEDIATGLDIIKRENDRLVNMVEELLDFSKLISDRMELNIQNIRVDRLAKLVVKQFVYRAKDAGIELRAEIGETPISLQGDDKRLTQCVIVLIDNAIKFTGKDGLVQVSVGVEKNKAFIRVKDNGEGIAEQDLPHITKKFYKGSSSSSGSGIGLSVCEQIIKLHDGELEIESVYGEGTTITMWLAMNQGETNEDNT